MVNSSLQESLFLRFWFLLFLLLIVVTWPLWWTNTDPSNLLIFHVPIFDSVPPFLQNSLLVFALGSLLFGLIFPLSFRFLPVISAFLVGLLIFSDLNRLQAWWIVFALSSWIMCGTDEWQDRRETIGKLVTTIYLFSGISKLDFQFGSTLGPQLLLFFIDIFGFDKFAITEPTLFWLSFAFPVFEIVIAFLLCWKKSPRLFATLAMLMHLILICLLGPSGRNNQLGVILWNVFFIGSLYFCFFPAKETVPQDSEQKFRAPVGWNFSLLLSWIFGLGGIFGDVDPWPAWELYSPSSSSVELWVPENTPIPERIGQKFLTPGNLVKRNHHQLGERPWVQISVSNLVLAEKRAPVYPHFRVQLPIAIALAEKLNLNRGVCIVVKGKSSRFTGNRPIKRIFSLDAGKRFMEQPSFDNQK